MAWHGKAYNRLINRQRWRNIRNAYLNQHPLCERCKANGIVTIAECVHHITPVEDGRSVEEMELLAYNINNLQSLCIPCHTAVHKEAGQKTSAKLLERKEARALRGYEALFCEDAARVFGTAPRKDSNPPANLGSHAG